ncbi:MAG: hypoxanthine phosphoribosyltransferase [Desulfobacterales bacterium]|nr:hypoxanthine phosphoribosyltransferase [Desulfobacterales bacterium]
MKEEKLVLLYSREEIARKVTDLANQISKDYDDKEVILICILKGAFIFLSDLIRSLRMPLKIDFVRLASYGSQTRSSGDIRITKDIELSIEGKDVVVVEDIVDTGLTTSYFIERLKAKNPNSLRLCALIEKKERREVNIEADYVGFILEEGFIVGYGLDFDERYRHLPEIYRIVQE